MIALSTASLYSYGTARVFELAAETGSGGHHYARNHTRTIPRNRRPH